MCPSGKSVLLIRLKALLVVEFPKPMSSTVSSSGKKILFEQSFSCMTEQTTESSLLLHSRKGPWENEFSGQNSENWSD